ncbi:MAG: fused MFS/spermidine synthase [Planctomycetaceae bacterium]|nr:fused MFS/spermidine synthase [Planctomycetaceae bacterium]
MAKHKVHEKQGKVEGGAAVAVEGRSVAASSLYLVVFLSGAALMALEMAGARLVEPHFGSTIYVWGSIIGVFMLALSLGYWGGGKFSDRSPKIETLGFILLLAALLVMIIPPIAPHFSAWMNEFVGLDVRYRTLIACLVLFALPSICMGMVSPFGIKLAARQTSYLGSVAGSLYAVSTLGSIVGTLLVSFVLVELIGTAAIVYGVGVLLAVVSVYCFFLGGGVFKKAGTALAIIGVGGGYLGAGTPLTQVHAGDKLLEVKESAYHYITIMDGRSQIYPYQLPARLMMFNNLIESGIILDPKTGELPPPPAQTACGYVDLLHLGMVLTGQAPRDMPVLGCGGGVGPRMFKENYPEETKNIDVVDIDPWVFQLAEKYFKYPFTQDEVIQSHVLDARMYVEQQVPDKKWDYIIMDAYSSGGRIPKHLITQEFFKQIRNRLTDDGVMVINVISAFEKPAQGIDNSRLFRSVYKTIADVWQTDKNEGGGSIYVFPRNRSGQGENIIMLATKESMPRYSGREFERRYRAIKSKYLAHTDLDAVVQRQLVTRPETDDVPLLTDDFCPTDSMVHR